MVEVRIEKNNEYLKGEANAFFENNSQFTDFSVTKTEELIDSNNPPKYISLDGNGIDLEDWSKSFFVTGDFPGFLSKKISDDKCNFNEPLLSFTTLLDTFTQDHISIIFLDDCCKSAKIIYKKDNVQIAEKQILLDSNVLDVDIIEGCNQINIIVVETQLPLQFIKISNIHYGKTIVIRDIKDINLLEETNILSDDFPANQLDFTMVSDKPLNISTADKMTVYSNNRFYGMFSVEDYDRIEKYVYRIKGYNVAKEAESFEFRDWYDVDTDFISFIENSGDFIEKSNFLNDYKIFGHIPICNARQAICSAAWGCNLIIDASRGKKIKLKPIPQTVTSRITSNDERILNNCYIKKKAPLTEIKYSYPIKVKQGKIITKEAQGIENYWNELIYDDAPFVFVEDQSPGNHLQPITDSLNYAYYNTQSGYFKFLGYPYIFIKVSESITGNEGSAQKIQEIKQFNVIGKKGSKSLAEDKKKTVQTMLNSTNVIHARIRLRNERVGDLIEIETAYEGVRRGIITNMVISFGYEDVADIEVAEWNG